MKNYIVIDGRKAELTDEQLEKLGIEAKRKSVDICEQKSLKRLLTNLLDKFAEQNNDEIDWEDRNTYKWHIYYDLHNKCFDITYDVFYKTQATYFSTREMALRAIDEIAKPFMEEYPKFIW